MTARAGAVRCLGLDFGFTLATHRVGPAGCVAAELRERGVRREAEEVRATEPPRAPRLPATAPPGDADAWYRPFVAYYAEWLALLRVPAGAAERDGMALGIVRRYEAPANWCPYPDAEEFLGAAAAAGLRLGILSNWGPNLARVVRHLGWDARFDAVLASSVLGVAKPERRAFHALADALGTAPEHLAFLGDDARVDCAGATEAGLAAAVWVHRGDRPAPAAGPGARAGGLLEALGRLAV